MPYIPKADREELDKHIESLVSAVIRVTAWKGEKTEVMGLLNYTITRIVMGVIKRGFLKIRYWHSPAIRGMLKDVGDEMYRRVFHKYEDQAIKKNGDIPEYEEEL